MAVSRWVALTGWGPVRVEEIMHRDLRRTHADMVVQDAARKMRDMNVGFLPVWEDDAVVGIITDRDITCRAIAKACSPDSTEVREAMSKNVAYCFEEHLALDAARIMQERRVCRLPVFDRDKQMVGIVTVGDLAITSPELAGEVIRALAPRSA